MNGNGKASVSKELDAKHSKILEGLLKLPENKECADCRSRAPRWASVNLGIFICMQCSGIHRSLGVHISKVRSTSLDKWLPEQVASMQTMGNDKSNKFWEAQLPPNLDRSRIETFIHTKYVERRWVQKGATQPTTAPVEMKGNVNKSYHCLKSEIPIKTRTLSLEDEILTKHIAQITPPPTTVTRSRGVSLDMNDKVAATTPPKFPLSVAELQAPAKKTNGTSDLYSLFYVNNVQQEHISVPPSRWATFDCKI